MNPPVPQRKPANPDRSLFETGTDLFGSLFGGGGFSGSSSATASIGPLYSTNNFNNDFVVSGQGGNAASGQGAPVNYNAMIIMAIIAGGAYIVGRK